MISNASRCNSSTAAEASVHPGVPVVISNASRCNSSGAAEDRYAMGLEAVISNASRCNSSACSSGRAGRARRCRDLKCVTMQFQRRLAIIGQIRALEP